MRLLYSFFIFIFNLLIRIYGYFNPKIKEWNKLRHDHLNQLVQIKLNAKNRKIIWMHCASLGEFEQGVPLARAIKSINKDVYLLLSFFSPSGYNQKKNTSEFDEIFYLPLDSMKSAKYIVHTLNPDLFIGVRYEFWWNLLRALKENKTEIIYISVLVKPNFYFLKHWLPFSKWLKDINKIFTQNEESTKLLKERNHPYVITAGDTRIVSVVEKHQKITSLKELECILPDHKKIIVYGSIYKSDMSVIKNIINDKTYFHIIVPHNIDSKTIQSIVEEIAITTSLYKDLHRYNKSTIYGVIVDSIGLLFNLYQYADVVYIGGGFEKNIHNTLEPAIFGMPIGFGPKNKLFLEAQDFMRLGIACEVNTEIEFKNFVENHISGKNKNEIKIAAARYFQENSSSIDIIMKAVIGKNTL